MSGSWREGHAQHEEGFEVAERERERAVRERGQGERRHGHHVLYNVCAQIVYIVKRDCTVIFC